VELKCATATRCNTLQHTATHCNTLAADSSIGMYARIMLANRLERVENGEQIRVLIQSIVWIYTVSRRKNPSITTIKLLIR